MSVSSHIPALRGLPSLGRYRGPVNGVIGMGLLLLLWWLGGRAVAGNPDMYAFSNFAPAPTLSRRRGGAAGLPLRLRRCLSGARTPRSATLISARNAPRARTEEA